MDNFKVALVKLLCPICGREADNEIIINSKLTKEVANEVEKLNGKAVGWANKCCDECAKHKDEVVYFIGIDSSKSDSNNFYRTGQIVGIKREAEFLKQFEEYIRELKDGTKFCFIEEAAGINIGLWKKP